MSGIGDVLDHARRGIVVASPAGEIRYLNDRFIEVTGLHREQVVGRSYEAFVHPEDFPREAALFGRLVSGELEAYDRRCRLRTAGGEVRWFRISVTAVGSGPTPALTGVMAALVLDAAVTDAAAPVELHGERILVREGSSILVVRRGEVEAIRADRGYSVIQTDSGPEVVRVPLRSFESGLAGTSFCRIHRSTIVDLEQVRALTPRRRGDAEVRLRSGTRFRVARSRRDRVEYRIRSLGRRGTWSWRHDRGDRPVRSHGA